MALLLRMLIPALLLGCLLMAWRSWRSRGVDPGAGLAFGQLRPGPHPGNGWHGQLPWHPEGRAATEQCLEQVLSGLRGSRLVRRDGDYWHARATPGAFRFIDDIELLFKEIGQTVEIRIERRGTWRDFGSSRRLLAELKSALMAGSDG